MNTILFFLSPISVVNKYIGNVSNSKSDKYKILLTGYEQNMHGFDLRLKHSAEMRIYCRKLIFIKKYHCFDLKVPLFAEKR
jgi:hypothetical protein